MKRRADPRFATPEFPQTRGGIYVCGINWGGRDGDAVARDVRAQRSFFSDGAVPSYRYRRRIESWFSLWGYPLATTAAEAGDLEYSLSQTNWLKDRSVRSDHRSDPKYLAKHVGQFLEVLKAREPAAVLLFGTCLGRAVELASVDLEAQLGTRLRAKHEIFPGKFAFTMRYFEYERCTIVALPHPTGAVGTTNAQAAQCRPYVRKAFLRSTAFTRRPRGSRSRPPKTPPPRA